MTFLVALVFLISLLVTLLMKHLRIMDVPGPRSSHNAPTPRAGGVAIVVSLLAGYGALEYFFDYHAHDALLTILVTAAAIGIMGILDDITHLSFTSRLATQGLCALVCVLGGISLKPMSLPFIGVLELGIFGPVLTVLWVMAFTNTFNFFDGLNGLASGCAMIALVILALLSASCSPMAIFYWMAAAAILGFFVFNFPLVGFPRAYIFLGDAGSQFLGFLLAELAVFGKDPLHGQLSFYTIPLLFFACIFDIALTLGRRIWQRENLAEGHRKHLFQLLQRSGWSHARVTLLHFFFMGLQGVGACYLQKMPTHDQWKMFLPYLVLQIGYAIFVTNKAHQAHLKF